MPVIMFHLLWASTSVAMKTLLWSSKNADLMASQKVANCFVAANCLVITAYLCTPHTSKFTRLAFDDFCLAIPYDDFLRIHQICVLAFR